MKIDIMLFYFFNIIIVMTDYLECFESMPDDIKELIYRKILYPQPKELLQEIRDDKIYRFILKKTGNKEVKPTLYNISKIISNMSLANKIYVTNIIGNIRINKIDIDNIN